VWTPTRLTPEQRVLLEQMAEIESAPPIEEGAGKKLWDEIRRAFRA
jgi:hypothetical protein